MTQILAEIFKPSRSGTSEACASTITRSLGRPLGRNLKRQPGGIVAHPEGSTQESTIAPLITISDSILNLLSHELPIRASPIDRSIRESAIRHRVLSVYIHHSVRLAVVKAEVKLS